MGIWGSCKLGKRKMKRDVMSWFNVRRSVTIEVLGRYMIYVGGYMCREGSLLLFSVCLN